MDKITVFPDNRSFVDGSAAFIASIAAEAIAERGRCVIALAGGSTPRPIYARLAVADHAPQIEWSGVHVFFGDERCVPPDDPQSNYRMAREALLDHVPLPQANVHRMRGEDDPALAALAYELDVQRLFRSAATPRFDLICLGMGDNGHTASLFPGTAALREQARWVLPQYVEVMHSWRLTLTVPLINAARHVAFLVEGAAKAETLWRVLEGPYEPDVLPAQLIQPIDGQLHWVVDASAATRL
jgi:6-phosphogluconolactonase